VLRLLAPRARILFYCHFPDQLLSTNRNVLKSLYRLPFDLIEEVTTLLADKIVVNSQFTAGMFVQTFRLACGTRPDVLYPCVSIDDALRL
jgi:alpha-1,3/alpha-1,6-mannosyltransferase